MSLRRVLATLAAALLAGGCATLAPPTPSAASDDCARWFARLDEAIDAAGVRDAQDERIAGFPGLRVDRLGQASRTTVPFADWLARAAALDRDALAAESANLPATSFPIDGSTDARSVRERAATCRDAWPARLAADERSRALLLERAVVPDRYSTGLRALGLYPVVRLPFFGGVQAWQREHEAAVARWSSQAPATLRFDPPADDPDAPIIEIEAPGGVLAAPDRFGALTWPARDAPVPRVAGDAPVLYRRESVAFDGHGGLLRQRVYTLWFSERPAAGAVDLLAGPLDGVIVRLTLAADGTPLVADTIHACGCWHQFYPRADLALRLPVPQDVEWAFVPARLPAPAPGQRLVLRLSAGTHQVMGLGVAAPDGARRYALRPEAELRSLPTDDGGRRSLYGPDGLVAGSARPERFLFWPMGIASAGAMRQWGHHATAFVGRRHFDDPNLLAARFAFPPGPRQ